MGFWSRLKQKIFPYDKKIQIGWGPLHLSQDHWLFPVAEIHDLNDELIIKGMAGITKQENDDLFLANALRLAKSLGGDAGDIEYRRREAKLAYLLIYCWTHIARSELLDYKPKKRDSGQDGKK